MGVGCPSGCCLRDFYNDKINKHKRNKEESEQEGRWRGRGRHEIEEGGNIHCDNLSVLITDNTIPLAVVSSEPVVLVGPR